MQSLYVTQLFSRSGSGMENWIEAISGNRRHSAVTPSRGRKSSWVAFCNIFRCDTALKEILNRPRHQGLCSRSPVIKSVDLYPWDHCHIWRQKKDPLLRLQCDWQCRRHSASAWLVSAPSWRASRKDQSHLPELEEAEIKQKYWVTSKVTYTYVSIRLCVILEITSL